MKATALILAAIAAITANAATEVFRLERDTDTGCLAVVGVDNVRRPVAVIDPAEYAMMTGNVAKVWAALNSTANGRERLHGKSTLTEVRTNEAIVVTHYADGYKWNEPMPKRTPPRKPQARIDRPPTKPSAVPERLWLMRQERERRLNAKPKEITIVHDATTGTDKEVK